MHPIAITLTYNTAAEAAEALSRLNPLTFVAGQAAAPIGVDAPDVGVAVAPPAPSAPPVAPAAFNPFAAAAEAAVVPAAPTVPVAPAAPASALPPASAPVAPTAGVPPAGVDLDSAGLPWDGRIHGSTKTKNADGSWRQKRGLNDDALKLRVEAELRAAMSARAPGGVAPVAAPTAPVAPAPAAATPSAPPAASAATPPASASAEGFGGLMIKLSPLMGNPATAAVVNNSLATFGLMGLASLASRADLWAPFATYVEQQLAAVPA